MFSGCNYAIYDEKGNHIDNPHWFEIARQRWAKKYKDSILLVVAGSEKYDRKEYRCTTQYIIEECLE